MQNDRVPYTRPGGKKPRPAAPRTPAPGRPPRKPAPRRRAIALGAVCALAVVLTVVIVILAGRDRGPQAPAVPDVGQSAGAWAKNENGFYFNDAGEPILAATSKGIDVSKYQGQVDWEKAQANGVEFALIRCGFGSEWNGEGDYAQDDEYWEYNADECTRLGIPFGTYLYSYATTEEQARLEGDHVARLLGLKAPDHEGLKDYTSKPYQLSLPVYYDLEDPDITGLFPDEMAALTAAFFDQLESYGYTGEQGIYASLNWTRARLTDPAFDAWRDNFWIARFNSTLGYTGPYTLWQASYTEPGAPYGVQSETVDVDFRMEELLITGFTDAKVSGAEPSFTNDTWENTLWLPNVKDKVTLTTDAVTEDEGGQRIFFASSDESVAAVSKKGVVTAKGEGSCTVTATLADGRRSAAVTVNVGAVTVNVYATGNLHGAADNGSVSLADVAALHAGDGGSILLDVGGSVQGTANTSLTGGMDMLSAFNAAGTTCRRSTPPTLPSAPNASLRTPWSQAGRRWLLRCKTRTARRCSTAPPAGAATASPTACRKFCSARARRSASSRWTARGYYAHAQGGESADALLRTMNEQVAALRAKGAQAIVCIAGPGCAVDAGALADLGVNAVLTNNPDEQTRTERGLLILQAGGGLESVAALQLTFAPDGSVQAADAGTRTAAALQSSRNGLSAEAQQAYDDTAADLATLAAGDESVAAQQLFTMEENTAAQRTISWGNFVAEVWLAYADGSRDAWLPLAEQQNGAAAELPLTALAGGTAELEPGEITRGALLAALPAGERLQLVCTTAEAVAQLIDSGTVAETYQESLVPYEAEGAALLITDTATLRTLPDQNYTVLQDYGDAFWNIRMNINDRTNNFAEPFVLPEAPTYGAGRN